CRCSAPPPRRPSPRADPDKLPSPVAPLHGHGACRAAGAVAVSLHGPCNEIRFHIPLSRHILRRRNRFVTSCTHTPLSGVLAVKRAAPSSSCEPDTSSMSFPRTGLWHFYLIVYCYLILF